MACCEKHLSKEIKQVEWRMKIFAIPFFSIITALLITQIPFDFLDLLFHIVFASVAIILMWYLIRFVIIKARLLFPLDNQFVKRMLFQISLSFIITIIINLYNILIYSIYHAYGAAKWDCFVDTRAYYLALITFAFLINAIYENLHRFGQFIEKELEAENLKKAAIEAQYQGLASKLNPHFLFNSLNTLSELIDENKSNAKKFIDELSDVYRYVLDHSQSVWVSMHTEIEFTKSYFELQKMRFEENLSLNINISEEYINSYILPQALQMLVENAIKHNEVSKKNPLSINVYVENNYLLVEHDKKLRKNSTKGAQMGLTNIIERYRLITGKLVEVINTEQQFIVKLPLIKVLEEKQ